MGKKQRRIRAQAAAPAAPAPRELVPARLENLGDPLRLPPLIGAVRLLQATATAQDVVAFRGGRPAVVPMWLRHPENTPARMTQRNMVAYAAVSLAVAGFAAWWAEPVGDWWWLKPVRPRRVDARLDPRTEEREWTLDGRPVRLVGLQADGGVREGLLVAPFLLHPEHARPMGPLQMARAAFGGYLDVEAFSGNVFRSGRGTTGRYLKTEQNLPPATLQEYGRVWMAKEADPMSDIPVLGGGLGVEDSMLKPQEAQWVESRQFNAQEVARMYGIPPRYLGLPSGDASTYATARDNDAQLLRFADAPITGAIADAWSSLLPATADPADEVRIRFSPGPILAATPLEENQSDEIAIRAGILTVDEVRSRRGLGKTTTGAPA